MRVRRNVGYNTPLPPEVPHALNPPDGVIVTYALASKPAGEIALDVLDASGKEVRHLSSAPVAPVAEAARPPHPDFWLATPAPMPTGVGLNRVNWDLRYDAPAALSHSFEINANPGLTPASPVGPLALPGIYTFRLTVDGRAYVQTASVTADPRSPASAADLRAQHGLLTRLVDDLQASWEGNQQAVALRSAVEKAAGANAPADVAAAMGRIRAKIDSAANGAGSGRRGPRRCQASAELRWSERRARGTVERPGWRRHGTNRVRTRRLRESVRRSPGR